MALFFVEICSDMDSVVLTKYGFIIQIHMNWSFTIEAFDILPLNKKYNNFGLITKIKAKMTAQLNDNLGSIKKFGKSK